MFAYLGSSLAGQAYQEELDRVYQRNFENSKLMRQILGVEYFW